MASYISEMCDVGWKNIKLALSFRARPVGVGDFTLTVLFLQF